MEEDIQNHSPTVMFRGTPCMLHKAATLREIYIGWRLYQFNEDDF